MALACLACHAMDNSTDSFRMDGSFRMQNLSVHSVRSDNGSDGCGGVSACFAKKPPPTTPHSLGQQQRTPASSKEPARGLNSFGTQADVSLDHIVFSEPRLIRCHAVRRDLFSNWTVGEVETEAGGRQYCLNLSSTA